MALAPERRAALLDWAATGGLVIEDDYDAEFRYDRQPVGALQGLAPARVVYASSASKTLAPALRLGWLVLPTDLVDDVAEAKKNDDLGSPTLDQLALARLIGTGAYDRHLRRARRAYRARHDALVAALERHAPELGVGGIAAGSQHSPTRSPLSDRAPPVAAHQRSTRSSTGAATSSNGASTSSSSSGGWPPASPTTEPKSSSPPSPSGSASHRDRPWARGRRRDRRQGEPLDHIVGHQASRTEPTRGEAWATVESWPWT